MPDSAICCSTNSLQLPKLRFWPYSSPLHSTLGSSRTISGSTAELLAGLEAMAIAFGGRIIGCKGDAMIETIRAKPTEQESNMFVVRILLVR